MPQYEVNSPDGKTYTVNAPEGATEQDAIAYVQKNMYKAPDATTKGERFAQGLRDPIDGGAQLLTKLLPDGVVKAGNDLNNWLADKTGLVGRLPEGGVDQQVRQNEAAYQAKRGSEGGFDGMRLLGNVLSPANLSLSAGLPAAATLPGRVAVGAAGGAATSAFNPVTVEGDYSTEKLKQIGLGGAFGAAVPMVTGAVGRVISPKASTNPDVQMLRQEGVTPTIGQALGGRFNALEEKAQSLPLMGDMISVARGKARDEFNSAAINRALAPINGKLSSKGDIGQPAVAEAGDLIGAAYDRARAMLGNFQIDPASTTRFNALRQQAAFLPPKEKAAFQAVLNEIATDVSPNGVIAADAFKRIDSKLGLEAAKFAGSQDAYQKSLGGLLQQFQQTLTDSAKKANPAAAEAFAKADKAYANLVRIEGASKAAMNSGGVFTPAQLASAVRGADRSVRDRATARGTALMQDLSGAGQNVLGNKVPDSGTAGRVALGAATAGSAVLLDPTFLGTMLGGAAMYTGPMRNLLSGAVAARPGLAQPVANALQQTSPLLVPLGAQVGLGLLN